MQNYKITEYTFGIDNRNIHYTDRIIVSYRGCNLWVVSNPFNEIWNEVEKSWVHDRNPSNRTEEFNQSTRYYLNHALNIAERLYKEMTDGTNKTI